MIGNGAPMLVALFSIPILIHHLGNDRFGILALAWAIIGYASLFDLGLGRALTQLVAQRLGAGREEEISTLAWTSLLMMFLLGLIGTAVTVLVSPWLVNRILSVPAGLKVETLRAFYLLGLSIPIVISVAGLRGLLEAYQKFALISALRIPMGVFLFAGPLLVLPFSSSLEPVVAILVIGRVLAWAAHLLTCLLAIPALRRGPIFQRTAAWPLLRFGSWMTVSNIISPLMVTLDRFVIGSLLSMAAVAYYATPYEVVTKFLFVPAALMGVMFPAFSTSFVSNRERTALLYSRCTRYLFLILFPVTVLTVGFARDGLSLWLGSDFARQSFHVLQWLAVGVFFNSIAQVPFALVQGVGRPDLTAKLHLVELPLYLGSMWLLISRFGIQGAAIAWTSRAAVDALVLFSLSRRFLPEGTFRTQSAMRSVTFVVGLFFCATLPSDRLEKAILLAIILLAFALTSWFTTLASDERAAVRLHLKPFHETTNVG